LRALAGQLGRAERGQEVRPRPSCHAKGTWRPPGPCRRAPRPSSGPLWPALPRRQGLSRTSPQGGGLALQGGEDM